MLEKLENGEWKTERKGTGDRLSLEVHGRLDIVAAVQTPGGR
jgi:hypothetical protein